jgi:hypothetical protein
MLFISARGGSRSVKKTTAAGFLFSYLTNTHLLKKTTPRHQRDKIRAHDPAPG